VAESVVDPAGSDAISRVESKSIQGVAMRQEKVFAIKFSSLYPLYVKKAESKNRSRVEVDQVICWLTGYSPEELRDQIGSENDLETFFARAPGINPNASLIKGVVCGIRVGDIENPLMQKIRYMDKLIDELAKGKALDRILRQ
jgi:hypothetical protein